ncbi:type II toxin-antitoxin system RelE/ParE family toxin [Bradyrhizobium sp.]|uniref:type II toxin-antitoxin system RelE/ParE family toxin n=1 Tax=Bradyrhizobium sp. TaxID=376 RepID=UPI003C700E24
MGGGAAFTEAAVPADRPPTPDPSPPLRGGEGRSKSGRDPSAWKPMPTIGAGVREIRLRDASGAFRVVYVATFAEAVHVLHAFQKKSQKTAQRDLDLAAARLRELKRELRS